MFRTYDGMPARWKGESNPLGVKAGVRRSGHHPREGAHSERRGARDSG
jgi:hypothetical protein